MPTFRSRNAVPQLFSYLEQTVPGGATDFTHALQNYAKRTSSAPGVCIVLSDFLDPNWEKGIRALLARRFQVVLLQILDPEEVEPTFLGDLRLVDAETGESREVSVTAQVLGRYRTALANFCGQLSDTANRHGMDYLRTTTDTPFEDLLLKTLRGTGLLR
jgi:sirohydrochlorin ferrochelatase